MQQFWYLKCFFSWLFWLFLCGLLNCEFVFSGNPARPGMESRTALVSTRCSAPGPLAGVMFPEPLQWHIFKLHSLLSWGFSCQKISCDCHHPGSDQAITLNPLGHSLCPSKDVLVHNSKEAGALFFCLLAGILVPIPPCKALFLLWPWNPRPLVSDIGRFPGQLQLPCRLTTLGARSPLFSSWVVPVFSCKLSYMLESMFVLFYLTNSIRRNYSKRNNYF